ncbi:MAG: hypothetical protein FJX57_20160, partial [Alphaproteobacteria bacterium]|nr:hypothetical protein [Alphaproteobacteria bacterium]
QADAISGLDLALWDLIGKRLGQPAYRLLGGALQTAILVDYTMGASTPEQMAQVARDIQAAGFRGVVVKIKGVVEDDVARVRAVRRALPSDHTVRVDCNAAYSRDQAFAFLQAAADIGGIEFVEQPVAGADLEGMGLCRRYGVPISADESIASHEQALAAVVAEACDVMNIKVPTVGGLFFARQTAAIAAAAGLPVVVGGRLTLEITRAASRHFAAVTAGAVGRAHEGPGPASQALSDDVARPRTTREIVAKHGGHVPVQAGPGLGIDVSWEKVEQYRVRA